MTAALTLAEQELSDIRAAFRPLLAEKDAEIRRLAELVQRERDRADKAELALAAIRAAS